MLFSATLTGDTKKLMRVALKRDPLCIGMNESEDQATVQSLDQGYVICPSEKRLILLSAFLKDKQNRKVMVFFSTCLSVGFHHKLLNSLGLRSLMIHGRHKQDVRTKTYFEFTEAKSGILLCTDVAARGLDIPDVDWIVQYDAPGDVKEYIHRVGRTARGVDSHGSALLFLRPQEKKYLRRLQDAKVPLHEYEFSWDEVDDTQAQIEKLVCKDRYLRASAEGAYRAFINSYNCHYRPISTVEDLDQRKVAASFGLQEPPRKRGRVVRPWRSLVPLLPGRSLGDTLVRERVGRFPSGIRLEAPRSDKAAQLLWLCLQLPRVFCLFGGMKRSVVGAKPDGDHLVGEDKDPKNRDLPPPGWKRSPWLLVMKGLSAHCAIWFGGLLFLTWFFSVDRALRTFFLNVLLALFIDVVLVAVLKAATPANSTSREPLSSNLSFPSGFTSRAFLVTLIVVKHSHLFPLFKLPFLLWCMAVAVCKLLMGRQFLGDSLAGVVLGYVEYYWIVCPLWMSERTASLFYNSFSTL
ncbi:hypothetical protein HPB48_010785 [Haemaphysalis longicornis]|uniref:ATP-dependent RNA helicase n=1 Tax=Haemaphysalis longicornis TaxID=44386 RepID=A0A9J6H286_HAELO|nr:hypothetical protein HPB48_010785 [Haemaphysalis longicornis]